MIVTPIRVATVQANTIPLLDLIDGALPELQEGSILAITSKVVSLCEGRVVPLESTTREALITQGSSYYLPAETSIYGHHFTITQNTLIASAGIDVSNAGGFLCSSQRIRKRPQMKYGRTFAHASGSKILA